MKRTFYTEAAYIIGIILLAVGTAFMEAADFGVSMVVAPAYILYLKLSQTWAFFTFGMAEYIIQALLLIILCIVVRKARISYLFSFITTIFYGIMLDLSMSVLPDLVADQTIMRLAYFVIGFLLCAMGVSMLFHTYIAPEAYELYVKEVAVKYNKNINVVKTIYDCTSCVIAVIMSFAIFGLGHFEGVRVGTIICALINGWTIGKMSMIFEKYFDFRDGTKLRKLYEE